MLPSSCSTTLTSRRHWTVRWSPRCQRWRGGVYGGGSLLRAARHRRAVHAGAGRRMAGLVVGPGDQPDTQLGPLVNSSSRAKVAELVDAAVGDGQSL